MRKTLANKKHWTVGLPAPFVFSLNDKRLTQNWYGPEESDCLIKT